MLRITLMAAMTMAAATPATAQDAVDDLFANPREAEERTTTAPEPRPAPTPSPTAVEPVEKPAYDPEVAETQRLNASVDAHNRAVRESNAAARAEYEQGLRDHEAWVARLEEEHRAEQAAYEAEVVRRQQEHEANLAAWRRRVEACQAGDISQCDPSTIR